jgi:hypothetical protein
MLFFVDLLMEKSKSQFLHATMKLVTNFENASVTFPDILQQEFDHENTYMQEAACEPENFFGSRL